MPLKQYKYNCGHTGEIDTDSFRWQRGWITTKCPRCTKNYRRQRSREARELNKAQGFPALTGSQKQRDWAETIRVKIFKRIANIKISQSDLCSGFYISTSSRTKQDRLYPVVMAHDSCTLFSWEEVVYFLKQTTAKIMGRTQAEWWINAQKRTLHDFLFSYQFFSVFPLDITDYHLYVRWPEVGDYLSFSIRNSYEQFGELKSPSEGRGVVVSSCVAESSITIILAGLNEPYEVHASAVNHLIRKNNVEGLLLL